MQEIKINLKKKVSGATSFYDWKQKSLDSVFKILLLLWIYFTE